MLSPPEKGGVFLSFFQKYKQVTDWLCYLAGSLLYAVSVNVFSVPNAIAPGGATGVATMLHAVWGLPIGTGIILINVPLLAAAFFLIGRAFAVRTMLVTLLCSVVIDATEPFLPTFISGEKLVVALFGGVLSGLGLGLIYLRGATTGGSEVAAQLLAMRLPGLSIGRLILLVDALVVGLSGLVFASLGSLLYAAVLIFVTTRVMDTVVYGVSTAQMVYIITERAEQITQEIFERLHRGVTQIGATGGYSKAPRTMLLCVVRRTQAHTLRALVHRIDPQGFIIVTHAEQVLGKGFDTANR